MKAKRESLQFRPDPKVVTFGEILLRLKTPQFERISQSRTYEVSFGGGEANVAVSLANFGIAADIVTRLPENEIGRACERELRRWGVGTEKIIFGDGRMGIYFLEAGAAARPGAVIYDRYHSAFAEIQKGTIDWNKALADSCWLHWTGITPAVSQGAADSCLEAIQAANSKGITVSCDLNYRKKLWRYGKPAQEMMPQMVSGADIVIGNEEDAEMTLGIKTSGVDVFSGKLDAGAYRSTCEQVIKRFPKVQKVAFTLRGSLGASHNTWAGILFDGRSLLRSPVYQINPVVDRVGAGDAFAAALIYGFLSFPGDAQKALNFAAAASCLKHSIPGDFNLVSVAEVEKVMAGDLSGRISR